MNKKVMKVFVYIMIFAMLATTLFAGLATLL